MTEDEWLFCTNVHIMLHFLGATRPDCPWKCSSRKWRLFACACCRHLWHMLADEADRHAIEIAEKYADKQARKQDLKDAHAAACATALDPDYNPVLKAMGVNASTAALWSAHDAIALVGRYTPERVTRNAYSRSAEDSENRVQCDLLRCIIGNPFRTPTVDSSWLDWQANTIPNLARSIYEDRAFDRLPILADALDEAGCDNVEILAHCRQSGEHVRGCWVVDLLLGKE